MTTSAHDSDELSVAKVALRRAMREALSSLSKEERERAGVQVAEHLTPVLRSHAEHTPEATVALFASLPYELPTGPITELLDRLGLTQALPSYRDGHLDFHLIPSGRSIEGLPRDRLGIPTPPADTPRIPLERCVLILVPGLAFGFDGTRLGQGGGYYDRTLAALRSAQTAASGSARPLAIGIGFDLQRVPDVPHGPLDQRVDALCTPKSGLTYA